MRNEIAVNIIIDFVVRNNDRMRLTVKNGAKTYKGIFAKEDNFYIFRSVDGVELARGISEFVHYMTQPEVQLTEYILLRNPKLEGNAPYQAMWTDLRQMLLDYSKEHPTLIDTVGNVDAFMSELFHQEVEA